MANPSVGVYAANAGARDMGPTADNVNAEDVLDLIVDISPWETPVVTMLPKTTASSTRHEWVEDAVSQISPRHGIAEGNDFAQQYGGPAGSPAAAAVGLSLFQRVRKANANQHFRYEVSVSNLQRMMNPFGVNDEYAYQVGKMAKQIGKDLESRILEDTVMISSAAFQGTETDPTRMANLIELICRPIGSVGMTALGATTPLGLRDALSLTALTLAAGVHNNATLVTGTNSQRSITETMINRMLEIVHGTVDTGGGHPDTVITSPAVYGQFGALGSKTDGTNYGALFVSLEAATKKIIRAVKFYDSQFGLIQVVNSRWCPQGINAGAATAYVRGATPQDATRNDGFVFFIERNRLRIAFIRPFRHVPLPPNGDSTRGMVLGDCTLELLSARSAAVLVGVNNVF